MNIGGFQRIKDESNLNKESAHKNQCVICDQKWMNIQVAFDRMNW